MRMVCLSCRKLIAENASRCPHCGHEYSDAERAKAKTRTKHAMIAAPVLVLVVVLIVLASQSANDKKKPAEAKPTQQEQPARYTPAQMKAALAAVKAEKKVVDAFWEEGSERHLPALYVSMKDDGSRQDGFAEYLCQVVREHGIVGGFVHIKDAKALQRNEWKEIGVAKCPG